MGPGSSPGVTIGGLPQGFAGGHRGGDRDIERAQPGTQRNRQARIGRLVHLFRHAGGFAAEQQHVVRPVAVIEIGQRRGGGEQQETMALVASPGLEVVP